jgi:ribosomal protein S18 acetylase RimI-like enzyme
MAIHASETDSPSKSGHEPGLRDAQILMRALRASVITSPEAFARSLEDVEEPDLEYWRTDIANATWAVIEQGDEVIGVGVARRPRRKIDRGLKRNNARFIESVWIAPEFRRLHRGEWLMRYLMEEEYAKSYAKSPRVRHFLLWVFDNNKSAIALYEAIGFTYVGRQELPDWHGDDQPKYELKYEYWLQPGSAEMQAAADKRHQDALEYGLTYRLLGENR